MKENSIKKYRDSRKINDVVSIEEQLPIKYCQHNCPEVVVLCLYELKKRL